MQNRLDNYPIQTVLFTQSTVNVTGAATGSVTLRYREQNRSIDLLLDAFTTTATATGYFYIQLPFHLPSTFQTQDEFIHVLDAGDAKVGSVELEASGLLTVYNVTNTGARDTFKINQTGGWDLRQSFHFFY